MEIKNTSKATAGLIVRDPVSTVLLSTHVLDVAKIMVEQNVGSVVVVRDCEPLGIITERDILERVVLANKNANEVVAQEIMTAPLLTIDSNRNIDEALAIMRKNHLRRLVVVNGDRLVGIVTERRLLLAHDSLE
jgi:CBS domain-containing protein